MELYVSKRDGKFESVRFTCTSKDFSPYDQFNALIEIENFVLQNMKVSDSNVESEYADELDEIFGDDNSEDEGSFNEIVNFSDSLPYQEVWPQLIYNLQKDEIIALIGKLKESVLKSMTVQRLVTFNSVFDNPQRFYL